jgi:hypothetical protein
LFFVTKNFALALPANFLQSYLALKRFNSVKWPQRFSGVKTPWAKALAVPYRTGEEFFEQ